MRSPLRREDSQAGPARSSGRAHDSSLGSSTYVDARMLARLADRVDPVHLEKRLRRETEDEHVIFSRGRNFFHIENWHESSGLIGAIFKSLFLHKRARANARKIQVRKNEVFLRRLPAAFDGFTILHITDLHLDISPDMPEVLSQAVADLDYDLCVLTGDYRAETFGPFEPALRSLAEVRPVLRAPVYAVLGNHDSLRMLPGIEDLDIRVLLNETVKVESEGARIFLSGVDDPHYFRTDDLAQTSAGIPEDAARILLAHSPEIYARAERAGYDLLLCGHTHGGQICLPGGIPVMCNARCPRKYCAGTWMHGGLQGYTSAGSGSCVVDLRLNCPPEVTLHQLHWTAT